jgi:hypothetical protein
MCLCFFSKLDALKEVAVRGMTVYGTLESHDLSVLVPSIEILDLSQNLLPSWEQVASITRQLKKLNSLNVRYAYTDKTYLMVAVLDLKKKDQCLMTLAHFGTLVILQVVSPVHYDKSTYLTIRS